MSELEHDKEFETYLARRSGVHGRLAGHDDLEPPPELDRVVLAKAREAIEMPRQLPIHASARWALPVALAATLVLSFAILLHFGATPRQQGSVTVPIMTDAATTQSVEMPPTLEADSAPAAQAKKESFQRPKSAHIAGQRRDRAQPAPATADAYENTAVTPISHAAAQPATEEIAVDSRSSIASSDAAIASAMAAKRAPPAEWLKRIEKLRAEGKTADAERELQEFRKAWPDYPVPEEPNR